MRLSAGSRLGPFEIVAPLGAGGMGEVYRAKDTRLGREVAVKVLPQHLSVNAEVRARFEREAKTVSSLNHPNICTLHDVGREGDTDYLVMELIDGETLAQRLARGALPLPEVFKYGAQIADALDRAHRAGVMHRDLKPGNVMVTRSGVKLMDFGLARAVGLRAVSDMTSSPTVLGPVTTEGAILGTFQYMAPEQLEGQEADTRADLWALGCVFYEMATGRRAFEGKSQASLITSIMGSAPPPISRLSPLAPAGLESLVSACLAKDPADRIQSAHDVKLQLEWLRDAGSQAGASTPGSVPAATHRRSRERLAWTLAAVSLLVAVAASLFAVAPRAKGSDALRASITPPPGSAFDQYWASIGLSPDGRTVAFMTASGAESSLWIRPLGSDTAMPVPDTKDVGPLFWSYDSRTVAFFGSNKLKKVAITGGSSVTIVGTKAGRGGAWNRDGVIVFAPATEGPLLRISSGGGDTTPVTQLDEARHETSHRFPCFLPDGDHFLYVTLPPGPQGWDTFVGSLGSKSVKKVLTAGSAAIYADPGYLVFAREGKVMAQRFDASRLELTGDAEVIGNAPPYSDMDAEPVASASGNNRLIVLQSTTAPSRILWSDRAGVAGPVIAFPAGPWVVQRLAPDGRRAAVTNDTDIWILDLERAMPIRLAPTQSTETTMAWSSDNRRLAFVSKQSGRSEIFVASTDGSSAPELVQTMNAPFKYVSDWSPDGKFIVFENMDPTTGRDIWLLPTSGERTPTPYLRTSYIETHARVSPDGRWLAYESNESGEAEVYVQSFPAPGHKVRVSGDGGSFPSWSRGGKELIYLHDGTAMSVPIETGDELRPAAPRPLFRNPEGATGGDMTADGERFLLSVASEAPRREIRLFVNWTDALPK